MKKPYFQAAERQAALWTEAKRWEHTPFAANQASLGYGAGCVELVHELQCAPSVGAVPRLDPLPRYTLDHGHHATETQLLRFLFDHPSLKGRLVFVPFSAPRMPGDLVGVLSGHLDHHLACRLQWGKVIHSVEDHGVVIHDEDEDIFQRRILYILRVLEA